MSDTLLIVVWIVILLMVAFGWWALHSIVTKELRDEDQRNRS